MSNQAAANLIASQRQMLEAWQQHTTCEFVTKDVDEALSTMTEDAHVLLVPVLLGGVGKEEIRKFYADYFIAQLPPDLYPLPISQTVGKDRIVEEAVYRFTHSIVVDWLLPGVPPTGKVVELAVVGIIHFKEGKIASEHLYWDQASLLVQVGLLDRGNLPIAGAEAARKALDPTLPTNELLQQIEKGRH